MLFRQKFGILVLLSQKRGAASESHCVGSRPERRHGAPPGAPPLQVGKYLGEKRNKSVLRASLAMKDFKGMHLDESLRKCLATMQPVMTTSGTRRILKAFARRFCECNPTYFCEQVDEAAETAYLLCFAMLMLNTDAHNSMVERKMTRQQFVAYIASSLNLKVKLPYLEGLYDRITRNEIRAEPDAGAMTWVRSMLNWVTGGQ